MFSWSPGRAASNRLYHNLGNGKFADVTKEMGLEHTGWGQGVCAGDFDNDGYTDLFVTYWGANVLYRNRGGHGFEDVTAKAGLKQDRVRYNTGCAFLDYDNDGHLDLFVANYLKFDFASTPKPGENSYCWYRDLPVACGPRGLPFDRNILYHNNGDGTFTDVSEASGIAKPVAQLRAQRADRRLQPRRFHRYLRGLRPDAVHSLHQPRRWNVHG